MRWNVAWILFFGGIVVTKAYEAFEGWHYMVVGLFLSIPPCLLPLMFPGEDRAIPWHSRYTTKANVWIFIISWQGNYFWTHYFYQVLGCKYTFPSWRLNNVPFCLFLITHSYFHLYHLLGTRFLRGLWAWLRPDAQAVIGSCKRVSDAVVVSVALVVLTYGVAYGEVLSIQSFPYYTYEDADAMFKYGSIFYSIYFIVSFPMFYRLDEAKNERWTLSAAALDSFAACMIVTMLLDFWRLLIGPVFQSASAATCATTSVPLLGTVLS